MKKRVLVTGATGKSGEYFLKELRENYNVIENEYEFGFIVRDKTKEDCIKTYIQNCDIYLGSLQDEDFLDKTFTNENYDVLLHIAGINYSIQLTKAAVNHGVKRLIYVHTTGIYSKYKAASKEYIHIEQEVEKIIQNKNVNLTILRPTMIYGNLNDNNITVFIKMVDKLRLFPTVSGARYELQPVWCGDLGKAYYQVLMAEEKTANKQYNLSGKQPIKLIDIFNVIAKELQVKNRFCSVPFFVAYLGAWLLYIVTFGKNDFREKVQRLVEPRVYSHEKATKDFGYSPISFEQGVVAQIKEYKNRG